MTLCGVLKDILLVIASMVIWHTPVTLLQFFGYSIALIGMIYYKLGADKIKEYANQANRTWAEYGATRPGQRRAVVVGAIILAIFLLFGTMAPSYGSQSVDQVREVLTGSHANKP